MRTLHCTVVHTGYSSLLNSCVLYSIVLYRSVLYSSELQQYFCAYMQNRPLGDFRESDLKLLKNLGRHMKITSGDISCEMKNIYISVQSTVYSVQRTVYSVQRTAYSVLNIF